MNRNVAHVADAPRLRSIPKVEPDTWTAQQLRAFLGAAAGHRLFAALWVLAATGMRRSELLGLKWTDIDLEKERSSSTAAWSRLATSSTSHAARLPTPAVASSSIR